MRTSKIFQVISILFSVVIVGSASASTSEAFVECLESNSQPSYPISKALYEPTNSSYSSILQFYVRNQRFNEPTIPKPLFILTASHVSHIQAAVVCAKSHGIEMRIRSGGHDFEGVSCTSDVPFFILDMFNLRQVQVDVEDETAWVEAGATLGEVYYRIAEKSSTHGFNGGMCPTVGFGGQISAGGVGNLVRKYGVGADNVIDAKMVDANGRLLDRASMGEDLFWAITGGGGSSFGVILSYKIRLVKVPTTVTVAKVEVTREQNLTRVVHKFLRVVNKLHEDLYMKAAIDVVGSAGKKTIRSSFLTLFLGDSQKLLTLIEESFPELGMEKAHCDELSWIDSVVRWTNFPKGSEPSVLLSRIHPAPAHMKRKSAFLKKPISKNGIELLFNKMLELDILKLKLHPFGGVMDDISSSFKPFPHRAGIIAMVQIAANWNEPGTAAEDYYINLTRQFYDSLTPFVSKSRDAYLNYRDFDLGINHHGPNSYSEAAAYGFKYFKKNFHRLVQIKSRVDPENFFRNEQSIPIFPLQADA